MVRQSSAQKRSQKVFNLQYRFLYRILPTNLFLTKIGIKQDLNCSFCISAPGKLIYLFWHCTKVKRLKKLTAKLLDYELIPRNYPRDIAVLLGLRPATSKFSLQLNFCFLLARHYIWGCKTSNKIPKLKMFLTVLKSQFNIESYKLGLISKKWDPIIPTICTMSNPLHV